MKPSSLEHFWMPFTANRQFKQRPKMLVSASGMHYQTDDGRSILDGTAGLWCVNAGHARQEITQAIKQQLNTLDFAPCFQVGHPTAFELAEHLSKITPAGLNRVFFTNSGSEAVDSALKIALAYHRSKGNSAKTRLIGREKGYHGTNFGGISVGGLVNNKRAFGPLLTGIDHLKQPWLPEHRFSMGLPATGAYLAEELEQMIALHGAETIAAVIVEPIIGAGGVWLPPEGYLQKLRAITAKHDILLIFDEVITGFGRIGTPFAANRFNVTPDLITCAKGITNGVIPMGAVFVNESIEHSFMQGPESLIELFHGYTYSGHPVAAAAALASLKIYHQEKLFDRALELEEYWQKALQSLKSHAVVKDIRCYGLIAAVELESSGITGERGFKVFNHCFYEEQILVRAIGDSLAMSPPLIISHSQIDELVAGLAKAIRKVC